MKQLIAILLCTMLICVLCACGEGSGQKPEEENIPVATLIEGTEATHADVYLPEDVFEDETDAQTENKLQSGEPDAQTEPQSNVDGQPTSGQRTDNDPKPSGATPTETEVWPIYNGDEIVLPPDEFDP